MIVASSDTTAIVTSAMFFYPVRNPAIQARLAAEVRAAFAHPDEIHMGAKLASCKYLHAFVQETLRMTPPVSAELCHVVMECGTTVGGQYFPEGVKVSAGLYCLSYDEEALGPDPFQFRPERWI
jgi:cytochrome P450